MSESWHTCIFPATMGRGVLQCVAVCCSVLQCVAVSCSVTCISMTHIGKGWVAVCCSVLVCVAVCCVAINFLPPGRSDVAG